MKFSENLRALRKNKDIKQEALAQDMGVSRQTVSKWENGTAMPDLEKLARLAEYFGVSMDDLLGTQKQAGADITDNINDKYEKIYYAEMQSQNAALAKRWKISTIALACVLAAAIIIFALTANSLSNKINSLSAAVNNLQSVGYVVDNSENYESTLTDDFSYEILSTDAKKPYLATVKFVYSPSSYSKNLKVSYSLPQPDGSAKTVAAAEKDGKFTVEVEVDVTAGGQYILYTDDGETKSNADVTPDFAADFFTCDEIAADDMELKCSKNRFYFSSSFTPSVRVANDLKIKSAEVRLAFDGEEPFFSKSCDFEKYTEASNNFVRLALNDFQTDALDRNTLEQNVGQKLILSFVLTCDNGVKYAVDISYYLDNTAGTALSPCDDGEIFSEYIDFGGGKILKSAANE